MKYLDNQKNIKALMIGITAFYGAQNAQASNISQPKEQIYENEFSQDLKNKSIRPNSIWEAQYLAAKSEGDLKDEKDIIKVTPKHLLLINMSRVSLKNAYERELDLIKSNNPKLFPFYYTSDQMKKFKRMTPEEINNNFNSYAEKYYKISGFNYYSEFLLPDYKKEKEKLSWYALKARNIKYPDKEEVIDDTISRFGLSPEIAAAAYIKNIKENIN